MKVLYIIRIPFILLSILISGFHPHNRTDRADDALIGTDADQWLDLYNIPDEWTFSSNELRCAGKYSSSIRTRKIFSDFVLDFEFSPDEMDAHPLLIIHSDGLPAMGKPFPDGIVIGLSGKKNPSKKNLHDYQIPEADLNPAGEPKLIPGRIYKYRITSIKGNIILIHNRKSVKLASARGKGFITLFSPAAPARFINLRISSSKELTLTPEQHQNEFISLFNGPLLSQWELKKGHVNHWRGLDWLIDYDGRSEEKDKCLWSRISYRDFELVADLKLTRKPESAKSPVILPSGETAKNEDGSDREVEIPYAGDTGIYLRGNSKSQVNIGYRHIGSGEIYGYRVDKNLPAPVRAAVTPSVKADHPPGEWNRFIITMKGDRVTVVLNGRTVIHHAQLPGIPEEGPVALQDDHADNNTFRFANLFIREIGL